MPNAAARARSRPTPRAKFYTARIDPEWHLVHNRSSTRGERDDDATGHSIAAGEARAHSLRGAIDTRRRGLGDCARRPRRCSRRQRRVEVRHSQARRHGQAAGDERHLQSRHGERVLNGQQPDRPCLHAAAADVPVGGEFSRGHQTRPGHRHGDSNCRQRHQRGRQDLHLHVAQRGHVGYHAAASGDVGRLRARVQDTLQPGVACRCARLLHEHDRGDAGVLRGVRQSQSDRRGDQ